MGKKDPRVDAYIAKSPDFAKPILTYLRDVIHQGCPDVVEIIKWGSPTFEHHGIMVGVEAFKRYCTLGFWKAPLLVLDGKPVTAKMESGTGQFGKLTTVKDLPAKAKLLKLVKDAAKLNETGTTMPRAPRKATAPVETQTDLISELRREYEGAHGVRELLTEPQHPQLGSAKPDTRHARGTNHAPQWVRNS
jgi:hypothetical protein